MADIPSALERREFLYDKPRKTPDYASLGDTYVAAGILSDAIECYEKLAPEKRDPKLKEVRKTALSAGDYFLLNRLHNHLPLEQSEWREAAKEAQRQGKLRYALKSAERAEDEALQAEIREALGLPQPGQEDVAVDYLTSGEGPVDAGDDAAAEGDPEGDAPVG